MSLRSIFGGYTDQLQVIIDSRQSAFRQPWYGRYFGFAPPQSTLTFTSAIGRSRIEAAASVVDRDAKTPLRGRANLEKLSGEIPAIKEMLKMSESDYRDYLAIQALNTSDAVRKQSILDLIFNDARTVGESAHKRLDAMCLQAVSTGKISLNTTNNPDGLTTSDIDLLMSADNKKNAAITWATAASATPLTDIQVVVQAGSDAGTSFSKILMDRTAFTLMQATTQVKDSIGAFLGIIPSNKGGAMIPVTLQRINDYLTANMMPVIEIVDVPIGIEKDGLISTIRPWETTNVAFVPDGQLGVIKNAIAIEQMRPVTNVSYANFNRALISKWSENEPFGEWTKVELNAFPAFESIDNVYLLSRTAAFS